MRGVGVRAKGRSSRSARGSCKAVGWLQAECQAAEGYGLLPETVEYPDHPWFIGVQYHPELKSKPFDPHPLFKSFIAAAVVQSRLV